MSPAPRVVLVAPFWDRPGHVGVYRVDRFIRWLRHDGYEIVLVRAASRDWVVHQPWGVEVAVGDPLEFFPAPSPGRVGESRRKPNPLRRALALGLLLPDPTVFWALKASKHPAVLAHAEGAAWVLSSSPPESAHIASARLAAHLGARLMIDLRDGWLDEPTRPSARSGPRRWVQAALEGAVLRRADSILVTSDRWKELLLARRPALAGVTTVLTNGYPLPGTGAPKAPNPDRDRSRLVLLHAGRFSGSRNTQKVDALLAPLYAGLNELSAPVTLRLIGALEPSDLAAIGTWAARFQTAGCTLSAEPAVAREALLAQLAMADGLLLLAVSRAAIPSKLFEYLPSGRPILAVTPEGSAVWRLTAEMPQVFRLDPTAGKAAAPLLAGFLHSCAERDRYYPLPARFSEVYLASRFRRALGPALAPGDARPRAMSSTGLISGVEVDGGRVE